MWGLLIVMATPSAASARGPVGYQYLTTYSGTYDFTDSFLAQPNAPDGLQTRTHYEWLTYDYETIVIAPDHTYTQTLTSYILARGMSKSVDVQGSGLPGGPFTTTTSCSVYSDSAPVETQGGGNYIQPVLAKQNPLLELGWTLPVPSTGRPTFHLGGTADCGYGSLLPYTPSSGIATVFTAVHGDIRKFGKAFSGAAAIHYAAIAQGPWSRRFDVTLQGTASRPGFHGPAVESAKVVVRSQVKFERVRNAEVRTGPLRKREKLVDLLLSEGFLGLGAEGPASGPPVGASGDPTTVVIPGFGPGEVSLDVTGTVLPGPARESVATAAAGGGTLLASGRTHVRRGGAPVSLTIFPTAAGRRLLKAPHPGFVARYTLSFRPAGSRKTYHGVRAFTVPARP